MMLSKTDIATRLSKLYFLGWISGAQQLHRDLGVGDAIDPRVSIDIEGSVSYIPQRSSSGEEIRFLDKSGTIMCEQEQ